MISLNGQGTLNVSTRYILPTIATQKLHIQTQVQKINKPQSEIGVTSRGSQSELYERKATTQVEKEL